MRTRLIPVALLGTLGAGLVLAQEPPGVPAGIPPATTPGGQLPGTQPGGQPGKGGQPPATGRIDERPTQPGGMMAASIEGNWTVVSAARNGKAVDNADKMTVTIKGNVVTFAGGPEKGGMPAMRIDFGPSGTVRVMEANSDGRFDTPGTPGVGGTPPAGGTGTQPDRPPPSITPSPPGGTPPAPGGGQPGTRPGAMDRGMGMSGVYVLTGDYLAVSVFEPGYASGISPEPRPGGPGGTPPGGVRPGGPGTTPPDTGTRPGAPNTTTPPAAGTTPPGTGTTPPAGGTGTQPGGTGTTPPAGGTGTQPGGAGTTPPAGGGTGTQPGGGTGTTPPAGGGAGTQPGGTGTQPGGGTGTQPGGTGTQPGGVGGTGTQPGGTVGMIGGGGPEMRSHISVILRRAGGAGGGAPPRP